MNIHRQTTHQVPEHFRVVVLAIEPGQEFGLRGSHALFVIGKQRSARRGRHNFARTTIPCTQGWAPLVSKDIRLLIGGELS